jgi:uncharacterized protein (UPF0179 family)
MWGWMKRFASTEQSCKSCQILNEQLREARLREQRLTRMIEKKDAQIGMVLESKFETFHVSGEQPKSEIGPVLPIESLMDVNNYDDEQFVRKAEEMIPN